MADYGIEKFMGIVAGWAERFDLDAGEAGKMARSEAYNVAGRWTDGMYTVPPPAVFAAKIQAFREEHLS